MLAIYTRLSRQDIDSSSIENQKAEGILFAEKLKFKDYKIYDEGEGISGGAEIKDRPQLFELLQDIRLGKINSVWFRNQNRLERNSNTYIIFISEAQKFNVKVYFGEKLFDVNNPSDNLLGTITSAINQYSKDLQSAQTKKVLKNKARQGFVWSIVPYGYKSEEGYLKIHKDESIIIQEIFRLSLKGRGSESIANDLNKKLVQTRKGALWRGTTVLNLIKNSVYKGERLYSNEVINSPIIIEPKLWLKVNENLKKNKNNSGKKVDHLYLLKGLLKCGECDRNYYGSRRADLSDNYYKCSSRRYKELNCNNKGINISFLEDLIWLHLFNEKVFIKYYKRFLMNNSNSKNILALNENISNLISKEKALDKDIDKLINNIISDSSFSEYILKKAKEKLKNMEFKKNEYGIRIANFKDQLKELSKTSEDFNLVSKDIDRAGKEASFNTKRDLVNKFIKNITLNFFEDSDDIERGYYISIEPKVVSMESIVYFAPFSKKYAIVINDFIDGNTKIDTGVYVANENKPVKIKINENWFNLYNDMLNK